MNAIRYIGIVLAIFALWLIAPSALPKILPTDLLAHLVEYWLAYLLGGGVLLRYGARVRQNPGPWPRLGFGTGTCMSVAGMAMLAPLAVILANHVQNRTGTPGAIINTVAAAPGRAADGMARFVDRQTSRLSEFAKAAPVSPPAPPSPPPPPTTRPPQEPEAARPSFVDKIIEGGKDIPPVGAKPQPPRQPSRLERFEEYPGGYAVGQVLNPVRRQETTEERVRRVTQ